MSGAPAPQLRLAELVATLSVATDLGKGLPFEQAQRLLGGDAAGRARTGSLLLMTPAHG